MADDDQDDGPMAFMSPSAASQMAYQTADQAADSARQNEGAFQTMRQARGVYQSLANIRSQTPSKQQIAEENLARTGTSVSKNAKDTSDQSIQSLAAEPTG